MRFTQLITIAILITGLTAFPSTAVEIYVKADGTGDEATIQSALNAAEEGDTVLLETATFTRPGNRDIEWPRFTGPSLFPVHLSGWADFWSYNAQWGRCL
jgi:hypothetical protein